MQFDSRNSDNADRTCILDCKYISTLAFSMEPVRDQSLVISHQSPLTTHQTPVISRLAFSMEPVREGALELSHSIQAMLRAAKAARLIVIVAGRQAVVFRPSFCANDEVSRDESQVQEY